MNDFSDPQSALTIILSGEKAEHLDMLEGGVVQRLLEEKWKTFARVRFCFIFSFRKNKTKEPQTSLQFSVQNKIVSLP